MALATVVEETPGVHRFHVQTAATTLAVRLGPAPGTDRGSVWDRARGGIRDPVAGSGTGGGIRDLWPCPGPRRRVRVKTSPLSS